MRCVGILVFRNYRHNSYIARKLDMTLREYVTKHGITLPHLSNITGVPYPTIKKNIDGRFKTRQKKMIIDGLVEYGYDIIDDAYKIKWD